MAALHARTMLLPFRPKVGYFLARALNCVAEPVSVASVVQTPPVDLARQLSSRQRATMFRQDDHHRFMQVIVATPSARWEPPP